MIACDMFLLCRGPGEQVNCCDITCVESIKNGRLDIYIMWAGWRIYGDWDTWWKLCLVWGAVDTTSVDGDGMSEGDRRYLEILYPHYHKCVCDAVHPPKIIMCSAAMKRRVVLPKWMYWIDHFSCVISGRVDVGCIRGNAVGNKMWWNPANLFNSSYSKPSGLMYDSITSARLEQNIFMTVPRIVLSIGYLQHTQEQWSSNICMRPPLTLGGLTYH